jgi:hypothetical protein
MFSLGLAEPSSYNFRWAPARSSSPNKYFQIEGATPKVNVGRFQTAFIDPHHVIYSSKTK